MRPCGVSIGPTLTLPIFDRGKWKTVRLQNLRAQEAALTYQRTVLNALHEVENALASYAANQQRRASLEATVVQDDEALQLSRQRYESGVGNFIDAEVDKRETGAQYGDAGPE